MATYKIPYYKEHVDFNVDEERISAVLTSQTEDYVPKGTEQELVREALAKNPEVYDPRKVIGPGLKGIEAVVVEKCEVFGCIGKAED